VPAFRRLPLGYGLVVRRPLDDEVAHSFVGPVAGDAAVRRDLAKLLRGVSPEHTLAAARRFGTFTRPVLLAWARDDRLFPLDFARRLANSFPRAQLEIIDDARTFVPLDQPARLAAVMAAFLARHPAATASSATVAR
jgi:pimeloyl-ACP methyl ester carboxylesterase